MPKDRKRKQRELIRQGQSIVEDMLEDNIVLNLLADSDEEEEEKTDWSQRKPNKEREHVQFHKQLMKHYFYKGCTHDKKDFCRQF
jgi:hypothetical protein